MAFTPFYTAFFGGRAPVSTTGRIFIHLRGKILTKKSDHYGYNGKYIL
jgi:hypothetical protein